MAVSNAMAAGGSKKKRPHKFLCGTPLSHCTGSNGGGVSGGLKGAKLHGSPEEAFKCHAKYMIADGYVQVGNREFCKGDGPIVVLTKKSKFGAMLRGGKGGRYNPKGHYGTGGTVVRT